MEWTGGIQRTCLAAAYLPANCGTAPVQMADLLRSQHAEDFAGTDKNRQNTENDDATGKTSSSAKRVSFIFIMNQ